MITDLTIPPAAATGSPRRVEILLATYNSATWLAPLMDSLLAQTVQDFYLIISDDCSTDDTVAILERYLPRFRHPVRLIRRAAPSGSAMANFATLMQISDGDDVFLCDADDVWFAEKLALFLPFMRQQEAAFGVDVPLFVYSDARIIDADGVQTHDSYWRFKKIVPARCRTLARLLVCAPMIGCASVMNRALVRLAADVPTDRVTGHDWWALLVAASLGRVDFLDRPTISYRVHGRNASQPKEITLRGLGRLVGKVSEARHEVRRRIAIRERQAAPLLERFGARMAPERRAVIDAFLRVRGRSFLGRRLALFGRGYTYPDLLRNAALLVFV